MISWSSSPAYMIEQRVSVKVVQPSPQDTDNHDIAVTYSNLHQSINLLTG